MKPRDKALKKKMENEYEMPKKKAISEHKRLVNILVKGNKKLLSKEKSIQSKELKEIKSE